MSQSLSLQFMAYNIPAMNVSPAPMVLPLISYLPLAWVEFDLLDHFAVLLFIGRDLRKP